MVRFLIGISCCLLLVACQSSEIPQPKGSIPGEWVAEAWYSTGSWVQRELFPCQLCYGFHGDVSGEGGPAHLVPDHRTPRLCPACTGMRRRPCEKCMGKQVYTCTACKGFGILECTSCELVRVNDIVVAKPNRDDTVRSTGCPECEWKGEGCSACSATYPNFKYVKIPDRGEIRYTSRYPCRSCRSRGWHDCPACREGLRACEACRGSGLERRPCYLCRGKGVILPKRIEFKIRRVRKRPSRK
ncbi:MAG: hypothetical protein ACYTHM_08440 [Planctomycetota bacterium]|jgi:hypothetical protein